MAELNGLLRDRRADGQRGAVIGLFRFVFQDPREANDGARRAVGCSRLRHAC